MDLEDIARIIRKTNLSDVRETCCILSDKLEDEGNRLATYVRWLPEYVFTLAYTSRGTEKEWKLWDLVGDHLSGLYCDFWNNMDKTSIAHGERYETPHTELAIVLT